MATLAKVSINLMKRRTLVIATTVVLLASFSGMITSAVAADNIKRSGCDMSKDEKLKVAYKWSTGSAVLSAGVAIASGFVLAGTMLA